VSDQDRITKRVVKDKDVNEDFQEALKHDSSLMIEENYHLKKNGWFGKKERVAWYQIYHETPAYDGSAYQAIYHTSGSGEKRIVIAYLHGIINGSTASVRNQKY
jgi:hypothetical protein